MTKNFPDDERFGLVSQLRRAAVSITSNIAEGFSRYYFKDKVRFYYMARGSASETLNLLIIAKDLGYLKKDLFQEITNHNTVVQSLINGLVNSISKQVNR
jgi:four helix bundle protein